MTCRSICDYNNKKTNSDAFSDLTKRLFSWSQDSTDVTILHQVVKCMGSHSILFVRWGLHWEELVLFPCLKMLWLTFWDVICRASSNKLLVSYTQPAWFNTTDKCFTYYSIYAVVNTEYINNSKLQVSSLILLYSLAIVTYLFCVGHER